MKKIAGILIFGLVLSACGSKGGGGDAAADAAVNSADANIGVYYQMYQTTNGDTDLIYAKISSGNSVQSILATFPGGNLAVGYYQKSVGTYVKSGSTYSINWSYETCNPVHSESLDITATDQTDRIFVKQGNTTITLLNSVKWSPQVNVNAVLAMTEDVGCTKVK